MIAVRDYAILDSSSRLQRLNFQHDRHQPYACSGVLLTIPSDSYQSIALTNRLETAKSTSSSDVVQSLSQEIAQLRKGLVDNTSLLPPYDRRQCEAQMAGLEGMLDQIRTTSTSKPKFAFKRKPASKPNPPPTAGPSTSATTPSVPARPLPSTYLTLSSKSHEHLTLESLPSLVEPSNTPQSDLTIADLDHCVVDLCTPKKPVEPAALGMTFTALHIRDIRDTILLLPSIKGSVLLHNATRCIIAVGCHQFRMHTSNDVDVYLSIPSNPIIEHCTRMAFASYPTHLSILTGLPSHPEHAMIVQDFSHIRPTPSPNWVAMSGDRRIQDWADVISSSRTNVDLTLEKYIPKSAET